MVSYFPLEQMSFLTLPATLLRRCYLGFYNTGNMNTVEHKLFAGNAPQLKDLSLLGCRMNWRPLVTVNLKYLEISEVFFERQPFLFTKEILEALSHSPHLRRLILNSVFLPNEEPFDFPTVKLPELKVLKVLSSLRSTVQLLSRLTFGLNPRIRIDCHPTEVTGSGAQLHDMQSLASIIYQQTSTGSPIRSLQIRKLDAEDDMTTHAWTTPKPWEKERFVIHSPSFGEEEPRARAAILLTLLQKGYSYLQYLDISRHKVTLSHAEWKRIGELDSLEELRITSVHAAGFLKVFTTKDREAQSAGENDVVNNQSFKVLRILHYSEPPLFGGDDIVSADAFRDMLDAGLKARENLKLNIPTLRYLPDDKFTHIEVF
ncbi:hypothetical protein C0993_012048 [Termitomyces sp. T159_Od127]|nr:hypothetical protein C0993_012048 [Termitomyces sp. T159_Od127]